tara:strand:- start:239844 stop:241319 length:1476 start_codon:yes stop_codon:yes gene_type:complete
MYTKAIALIAAITSVASAQNAFTYQGTLNDEGAPANGNYDMRFTLWTDATIGAPDTQIGSVFTNPATGVVDGLFSVSLDLDDSAFQTQASRYLQIEVRFAGDPGYTTLSPRQRVDFAPRAFHSLTAEEAQSIELPYSDSSEPGISSSSVFSITNIGDFGSGIRGAAPTWGVRGYGGDKGVFAPHLAAPAPVGVFGVGDQTGTAGTSIAGTGVWGRTRDGIGGEFGVLFDNPGDALHASTAGPGYAGVFRKTLNTGTTPALLIENSSESAFAYGLHSIITSTSAGSSSTALRGQNNGDGPFGIGVWGSHDGSGWGVYGQSNSGFAGRFAGDVSVTGTLSKSGGSFKIDHPQDPENMYLSHSFVESPDMKNIYDGVVTLNRQGQAIVTLPTYFNALNQEFRYQLTCIGGYAPVYIAAEIESSTNAQQFAIAGGTPGLKVSWQVTGIRHDAWANQNRIPTEELKEPRNQGKYLNPKAFNQPKEKGIDYIQQATP